jgi:hypothetical protein
MASWAFRSGISGWWFKFSRIISTHSMLNYKFFRYVLIQNGLIPIEFIFISLMRYLFREMILNF